MIQAVEWMMIVSFYLWGVSLFFRARDWNMWIEHIGNAGILTLGITLVFLGSFIIFFHPVWHGALAILTILGLLTLFKGAVYILFPNLILKMVRRMPSYRITLIRLGGFILMAVSLFLACVIYRIID